MSPLKHSVTLGREAGSPRLSVRRIFSGRVHQAGITGVAFLGDYMITASLDRIIRVWRKVRGIEMKKGEKGLTLN